MRIVRWRIISLRDAKLPGLMPLATYLGLLVACSGSVSLLTATLAAGAGDDRADTLSYGDGGADGKQSLGGSGELIKFTLPAGKSEVAGLRIHGSRYGFPEAPEEHFLIYFMNAGRDRIVATEMAAYALFERGPEKWVTITFAEPVPLPAEFWVALDFRANQRKGVFVSYDTSTKGEHSRVGLPGMPAADTKFGGDWMVEVSIAD